MSKDKPPSFPDDHYTRDWDLLEQTGKEWAKIEKKTGMGYNAKACELEKHWATIIRYRGASMVALQNHVMSDELLKGSLGKYFRKMARWKRRGITFEQALNETLLRIYWQIVKSAKRWHRKYSDKRDHWGGRFWGEQNLTKHLERAIKAIDKNEGVSPSQEPETQSSGGVCDPADGRSPQSRPVNDAAFFEGALADLSENEAAVYKHWYYNCNECSPEEEDEIAKQFSITRDELNAILTKVLHTPRPRPPRKRHRKQSSSC